ncbi:TPA: restriction endonuclease subunit S, partial [Mannheimia haemolytica]|nr:restriction endonuclease subunit S [Mannheimia haemolytica]HDZ6773189.1 restriction endonuclease subunit S [Mannheimia haemolytica]
KSEGSGQPNISKEKIINYLFPLPPIHEQHRIVQKIEQLFAEIEKL